MVARITGFISRADAGLIPPRSVNRNVTPERGGVAPHHGGERHAAAEPNSNHSLCLSTWRAWQRLHMGRYYTPNPNQNGRHWVDIAYNGAYCNHGYALAGRGYGIRSAAQGTNLGNQNFLAVVWIGGVGNTPTEEAFDALDWWVQTFREAGAGLQVRPHSFFKATACPIPAITRHASLLHNKEMGSAPIVVPPPPPTNTPPAQTPNQVRQVQTALKVTADGKWGPITDTRAIRMRVAARARRGWPSNIQKSYDIRDVQEIVGTTVDGIWGPLSQASLVNWIKQFQKILNVKVDGWWGPKTDGKFLSVRRKYLNNF